MKSKNKFLALAIAAVAMLVSYQLVFAMSEGSTSVSVVKSIKLSGQGENIYWQTEGTSAKGFKIVWSKNGSPVYPLRDGDRYHYYTESSKNTDKLDAFSGAGTYHVRVCEYLGGKCGIYSNEILVRMGDENQDKPVLCTTDYTPACGELQVYCIKAPCPPQRKTYSNKCKMEQAKAKFLYYGECKDNPIVVTPEAKCNAKIYESEAKIKKLEKEYKRIYSLIKLREKEIKMLRESLEQ